MSAPSQPLQPLVWLVAPALIAVAATVLLAVPLRLFGLSLPEPVFPMVLAFAWAVIRPSILGPFLLLLSGLFLDLFWNGELGLWALSLILVYGVVVMIRSLMAGQPVLVLWLWYGLFTLLAFGLVYAVVAAQSHTAPNLLAVACQSVVTIMLFPFARRLIEQFEDADIRFR